MYLLIDSTERRDAEMKKPYSKPELKPLHLGCDAIHPANAVAGNMKL